MNYVGKAGNTESKIKTLQKRADHRKIPAEEVIIMQKKKVDKFIQKADLRKGALHRQLGIPPKTRIPPELLIAILDTPIWNRLRNPSMAGKRAFTVTPLLWHRAQLAYNMLGFKRKKGRK